MISRVLNVVMGFSLSLVACSMLKEIIVDGKGLDHFKRKFDSLPPSFIPLLIGVFGPILAIMICLVVKKERRQARMEADFKKAILIAAEKSKSAKCEELRENTKSKPISGRAKNDARKVDDPDVSEYESSDEEEM